MTTNPSQQLTSAELRAIAGILIEHTLVMAAFAQQAERAPPSLALRTVARFREKACTCEQLVGRIHSLLGMPIDP
jgi:hypothetical protein